MLIFDLHRMRLCLTFSHNYWRKLLYYTGNTSSNDNDDDDGSDANNSDYYGIDDTYYIWSLEIVVFIKTITSLANLYRKHSFYLKSSGFAPSVKTLKNKASVPDL